jgi:hypothetical protein
MLALCHAVYEGPIAVYLEITYQHSSSVWFEYCVGVTTCWSRWHSICWFISISAYTGCPTNFLQNLGRLLGLMGYFEREKFLSALIRLSASTELLRQIEETKNSRVKSFCLSFDSTQRTRERTLHEDISWTHFPSNEHTWMKVSGMLPRLMCKLFNQQITLLVAELSNAVALWNTFCFLMTQFARRWGNQQIQFPCVAQQQYALYFSVSFQHRFSVNIWCGYIHYHLDWFCWESCSRENNTTLVSYRKSATSLGRSFFWGQIQFVAKTRRRFALTSNRILESVLWISLNWLGRTASSLPIHQTSVTLRFLLGIYEWVGLYR